MTFKYSKDKLQAYVEAENFKGYDPYDTLNSPIPFHWLGKWGPVLASKSTMMFVTREKGTSWTP